MSQRLSAISLLLHVHHRSVLHHRRFGRAGELFLYDGQRLGPGFDVDGVVRMADEVQGSPVGIRGQDDQLLHKLMGEPFGAGVKMAPPVFAPPNSHHIMGDLSLRSVGDQDRHPFFGLQQQQGEQKGDGRFVGLAVGIADGQVIPRKWGTP